jgi:hypothetical protein
VNFGPAMFRRIERRALVIAAAGMVIAFVVPGGGMRAAVAVAGGALVMGVSYVAIRKGLPGVSDAAGQASSSPRPIRSLILMVLRYALLAVMAYVMIARLRLPLLGLLGGVSVIPVAAAFELSRRQA